MSLSWADALDQFEANLLRVEQQLETGKPDELAALLDWPPVEVMDLPFPAALGDRGHELFSASEDVQQRLLSLRDALPKPALGRRRQRYNHAKPSSERLSQDL